VLLLPEQMLVLHSTRSSSMTATARAVGLQQLRKMPLQRLRVARAPWMKAPLLPGSLAALVLSEQLLSALLPPALLLSASLLALLRATGVAFLRLPAARGVFSPRWF
jgi:hypothetical protein